MAKEIPEEEKPPEMQLVNILLEKLKGGKTFTMADIRNAVVAQESASDIPLDVKVTIAVSTPGEKDVSNHHTIGSFYNRSLTVKRVEGVDEKYVHDLELLEGDYKNIRELDDRIRELNALYNCGPNENDLKERALAALRKKYEGSKYELPFSTVTMEDYFYIPELRKPGRPPKHKLPISEASKDLDKAGIPHLRYCMRASYGELSANPSSNMLDIPNRVDVANIFFALLNSGNEEQ
jgi:hypothetical protein